MAKIAFRKVTPDFLSKFPFVNLQIKAIVESLCPIKACTQLMKKRYDLLKNMHFGIKIIFRKFSNLSISVGLILLVPLAFWVLLIWTSCSSYLEMISKGPGTQKIFLIFKVLLTTC